MKKHFLKIIILSGILLITPQVAFAYLDAGTGSQILQIGVATFIGGIFVFKAGYRKIKALLRKILFHDSKGK
ncbi:hypothetical protein HZA42_01790 [Candidatus Peregrinibacteria bacterium]|nr:hypothetical protein [Candidatus Peregrinibacteria bacterium]